jgi:hypothetical protein
MRIIAQSRNDMQRHQRMEALVTCHLRELFNRLPTLAGFRLQNNLMLADLSVFSWPMSTPIPALDEIVMQSLLELAESHPEAIVLMRGRTFARSLH